MRNMIVLGFLVCVVLSLASCGQNSSEIVVPSPDISITASATNSTNNPTPIPNPTFTASVTPIPSLTIDPVYQAWYNTAIAVQGTANAISQQIRDSKATEAAQFPIACEDTDFPSGNVSPNGDWLATSCGYKRDQLLVVQNKSGIKWVLDFKKFLTSDMQSDGGPGFLKPISWSPDGNYLYFVSVIGYDGGGNDCFPGYGVYSLSRLNLKTGSWVNLISPTDLFPGFEITFSPTGRRYAADIDGVLITDLQTGEVTKIDVSGVMDLIWSPDGTHLAYSVASCGEQNIESSTIYVWDALKNQTQSIYTVDGILLRPESWIDNSTLRITGEKYDSLDILYTVYVYDLLQEEMTITGTATPTP